MPWYCVLCMAFPPSVLYRWAQPHLVLSLQKLYGDDYGVIKALIRIKQLACLDLCHIVSWQVFGPSTAGMLLASSLDNLILCSHTANMQEGTTWPSPLVAFGDQLADQVMKAAASHLAYMSLGLPQRLQQCLQLALEWLPGFASCQEVLDAMTGGNLSYGSVKLTVSTGEYGVWEPDQQMMVCYFVMMSMHLSTCLTRTATSLSLMYRPDQYFTCANLVQPIHDPGTGHTATGAGHCNHQCTGHFNGRTACVWQPHQQPSCSVR